MPVMPWKNAGVRRHFIPRKKKSENGPRTLEELDAMLPRTPGRREVIQAKVDRVYKSVKKGKTCPEKD